MILLTVVSQGSQRRTVYERAICSTNFPPRNAAVQRVPVPKKGRTELEFVMNGMRQKWCMACFCNVIGFYQLLSFWPEKTGPRTQTCFKSIEKPGFVSPFQGVQQGHSGLPSHSQTSTKCHACALGCGQNAWLRHGQWRIPEATWQFMAKKTHMFMAGWWLKNNLEKWWSSSMVGGLSHIYIYCGK